ncbi:MAG: ATP-dependent Clp protease proteolytic subunit, partial [Clostridia bacterium]|nr:ATP-dependent Clp protease proteolytic subunit [Clostridia bacterium]
KGRRFILPHSKVMIHEPLISNGFGGSATKIEQKAQMILDVKRQLNEILAKHTGKSLEEINKATAFDNFMSAEEAVEFGICDAIGSIY